MNKVLLVTAGKACSEYQDQHLRHLTSKRVQVDEISAFCCAKARNVPTAKRAPDAAGDLWTWLGLDAHHKLIVSFHLGGRDAENAALLMDDLAHRLAKRVQLTSDGHRAYLEAVEGAFGNEIDYPQLIKIYSTPEGAIGRYSPGECIGTEKRRVEGRPDPKQISTSYVERQKIFVWAYVATHGWRTHSASLLLFTTTCFASTSCSTTSSVTTKR